MGRAAVQEPDSGQAGGRIARALRPGVSRREFWAWAMYDFANSGYTTVVLTTVFNAYFVAVVAQGASWATLVLTGALSLSYLAIMISMPALGILADARAAKRRLLFLSTAACVLATVALMAAQPGRVVIALAALGISNYFYCMGESLIAAFLPGIARAETLGRVSGWGWGWGYFGGMLTLGLSLVVVSQAEARGLPATQYVPWVMALTALIFALAAIPSMLWLKERSTPQALRSGAASARLGRLWLAWQHTGRHYPDLRRLYVCGACYHAGIAVVITLAAVYASQVMGFSMSQTMVLIFAVNIGAALGAIGFGHVQDRIGHRVALAITLLGWLLMVVLAAAAREVWVFWLAAVLAGLCMGTSQSAGRAMVGALAPPDRPAEHYALWTFAIQLAAVVGPLFYGLVTWATAGQHRLALLCTGLFFVAGLLVLARIDFERGRHAVQDHMP
ncbi:MAG: MFS transporter [Castellaniella sp.]